jgi:hypothetical protein
MVVESVEDEQPPRMLLAADEGGEPLLLDDRESLSRSGTRTSRMTWDDRDDGDERDERGERDDGDDGDERDEQDLAMLAEGIEP